MTMIIFGVSSLVATFPQRTVTRRRKVYRDIGKSDYMDSFAMVCDYKAAEMQPRGLGHTIACDRQRLEQPWRPSIAVSR